MAGPVMAIVSGRRGNTVAMAPVRGTGQTANRFVTTWVGDDFPLPRFWDGGDGLNG